MSRSWRAHWAADKSGRQWLARCPAHDDRHAEPVDLRRRRRSRSCSTAIAGCDARDVIAALRDLGLWPDRVDREPRRASCRSASLPAIGAPPTISRAPRRSCARAIRSSARSRRGTLKGATSTSPTLPTCLRFHPTLWHSRTRENWPAMVAPLRDIHTNEIVGVHRTFLARDGSGKAPIEPPRMVLGRAQGRVHQADARRGCRRRPAHRRGHRNLRSRCMQRDFPADVGVRRRRRHPRLSGAVRHRVPDHRGRSRSRRTERRADLRRTLAGRRP